MNPYVTEATKLAIAAYTDRGQNNKFIDVLMKRSGHEDVLLALFNYYLAHIEIATKKVESEK